MPVDYSDLSHDALLAMVDKGDPGAEDAYYERQKHAWWLDSQLVAIRNGRTLPWHGVPSVNGQWDKATVDAYFTRVGEVLRPLIAEGHPCLSTSMVADLASARPDILETPEDSEYVFVPYRGAVKRTKTALVDGKRVELGSKGTSMFAVCAGCAGYTRQQNHVVVGNSVEDKARLCAVCYNKHDVQTITVLTADGRIAWSAASKKEVVHLVTDRSEIYVHKSQADYFHPCDRCGHFSAKTICEDCSQKIPVPGKLFAYHGSDPTLIGWFPAKVPGARYFGLEVEVFAPQRSDLLDASKALPWLTVQRDGSLDDYCGAEIISAPHTFEALRARFLGAQGKRWREAMKAGLCSGHNRRECGIHIHVSRDSLAPETINRVRAFVASSRNQAFLDVVAQRVSNQYCVRTVSSDRKYEAFSTSRSHTVEFRLFRSNTRCDRILKNIEFAQALIEFAESDPIYLTWKRFVGWLSLRVERFPFLCAFLMEHRVSVDAKFLAVSRRMSLSEETDSSLLPEHFYVEDFLGNVGGQYLTAGI